MPPAVSRSRLETNFLRLLAKCETMALETSKNRNNEDGTDDENWRLEKYSISLQDMLTELRNGPSQPDRDLLMEYGRRLDLIKGVLQTSKLPNIEEQALASQLIQTGISNLNGLDAGKSMEIKQRHRSKYAEDLRKELFGTSNKSTAVKDSSGSISSKPNANSSGELDELLKYQHSMQEKIADHMLDLTRSLKDQVSLAGQIVKNDTETLEKSSRQIDTNQDKLKVESEKLEVFNKRACKCWVWFMLALVCSTFMAMVLFMRLFKKRVILPEAAVTTDL